MLGIFNTMLARYSCSLEITGIYLNTRLVGKHLHEDTSDGRVETCTYLSVITFAILISVQTPVVIVAGCIFYLVEDCLLYTSPSPRDS